MNPNNPALLRALMAAAALLLVVGVIGAITVDSDDTTVAARRSRDNSTTSSSLDTTTTTEAPATAGTPAATTSSTARGSSPTTAIANAPDPGPIRAPSAGTYLYSFTNTADPSLNGNNERKVEELAPENGATRRRQTQKDAQGNSLVNEETWSNDAVRVTASHIGSGGYTVDCVWQPGLIEVQLPLATGKSWKVDSTCTATVGGTKVTIRRSGDAKVTGKTADKVGDTTVGVWVIESTITTSVRSAFFNDDTKETTNTHFASGRGLTTKETGTIESASRKGSYELTLQSLTAK